MILLSTLILALQSDSNAAASTNAEVLASAKEKGKTVADYLIKSSGVSPTSADYFYACSFYGACLFGTATKDTSYYKTIYTQYKKNMPSSIATGTVDKNSVGIVPLHLFKLTNDSSLLKLGKAPADVVVKATSSGSSINTASAYVRTAIDDSYMVGSLMVQTYRATHDTAYLNFCAAYISYYMSKLQQPNGLYWHKLDSKNFWGRGNGWGAASSTELLQELPVAHAQYATILEGYKKQMAGLLTMQQSSGMWMQLLDSKDPKNWVETSGSAMFLFAIFTGLKNGWLDQATYLEPAKKGWTALTGYLQSGKLTNVAAGFWPTTGAASDYLNASKGQPGDGHGTAALLWAAAAAVNYLGTATMVRLVPDGAGKSRFQAQTLPGAVSNVYIDLLGRAALKAADKQSPFPCTGLFVRQSVVAEKKLIIAP